MAEMRLGRLPDRTPVRLTLSLSPVLAADLESYARLYREHYGREEPVGELIPAILTAFLDGDRAFAAYCKSGDRK